MRAIDSLIDDGTLGQFRVRIIAPPNARFDDVPLRHIPIEHVGRLRGHLWEQLVLPRHLNGDRLLCLGNVAPIETLVRRNGGSVGLLMHDMSYRLYPHAYRASYRLGHSAIRPFLLRYADPIFTVSECERERIIAYSPATADRLVVAQNGSWRHDLPISDLVSWSDRRSGYGLYVGAFSSRKNIEAVRDLAIELARDRGMRFVMVGATADTFNSTSFEIPHDVRHLIDLRGQIESSDALEQIYRDAAFLVFPSFYEASPLPPVEAMTFACPVIASDIPAMRERCGDAALYCDPHDPPSIRAAVDRLLTEVGLAQTLVDAGLRQAARFSWRTQALTMLKALEQTG